MKKIIVLILFIIFMLYLFDYYNKDENKEVRKENLYNNGVFISYLDYSNLKGKDEKTQKKIIDEMIKNVNDFGLNTIILQVRSFSDAIYNSKYFKTSSVVVQNEGDSLNFDILEYFIKESKKYNIDIYAWINPYRIRNNNDISTINKDNIYYKWIDTNKIEITEGGIYFNPADKEVLDLIIKGVEEIVQNYDVKAVIYDDYFYPDKTIDLENYKDIKEDISIDEYRTRNINNLIKETYKCIKDINPNILFGISPSGNIENNLKEEYIDVEYLLNNNLLDFVIPQLYYGFENDSKPFINTLKKWNSMKEKYNLYVALALYKSGNVDNFAGSGKNEWIDNTNVISNEVKESMKISNYKGFYIFRYHHLFDYINDNMKKEVDNLKYVIYKN